MLCASDTASHMLAPKPDPPWNDCPFSQVCGYYQSDFTDAAATVACKQMGLKGPGIVSTFAKSCYGEGKGPVWLKDVACTGTEPGLQYCSHDGWGVTTDEWGFDACGGHSSDIGIKCNWKPTDPMC